MHILVAGILAALGLLIIYGLRPVQRWRFRHIPGPPIGWMIGNLAEIVRLGRHEAFRAWGIRYGPVFRVVEGGVVTVVVQDAQLAHKVAGRMANRHSIPHLESGEEERLFKTAAGILFARGAHHRGLRAAWQPMFHSKSLEGFMGIMDDAALRLLGQLEEGATTGCTVDIWPLYGNLTMRISGTSAFGVELSDMVPNSKAFFDAVGQIENIYALLQIMFPPLAPQIRRLANIFPTPAYAAGLRGRRALRTAFSGILKEHRAAGLVAADGTAGATGVAPGSFLELMARSVNKETGQPFSDLEIVLQSVAFVLAAYETSAATLSFATYFLASHPDKQAAAVAEVDAFGRDTVPTAKDLQTRFPYLEAVLKETLRLFPPVALTIREADQDVQLGKYAVRAGTHLTVSIYGMHHDPACWTDPEAFKPERFIEGCNLDAYMPFGEGARGCVGQKYAWQELLIVLMRLFQRYTFTLAEEQARPVAVKMSFSLTPRHGVKVKVHKRP